MTYGFLGDLSKIAVRLDRYSMPEPNSGCWLWIGRGRNSYGHGTLGIKGHTIMAHRLAWICARGPIPDGLLVLHKCDVAGCVNPEHLFLGTHQDNSDDAARKGRTARGDSFRNRKPARGERNGNSRLTADAVRAIRAATEPQRHIAAAFGVTQAIVSKIKRNEVWTHV
jgi:hypothetical protein